MCSSGFVTRLARGVASAAPRRVSRVPMVSVRAFREGEKGKEVAHDTKKPGAELQSRQSASPAPYAAASDLLPFRRMADAMNAMQREMDAMMGSFGALDAPLWAATASRSPFALLDSLGDLLPPAVAARPAAPARRLSRLIPLEVDEDDTKYTVRAEVPGFTKDDIKITLDPNNDILTITGERGVTHTHAGGAAAGAGGATKEEREGGPGGAQFKSHMSFTRSFTLPPDVDMEKAIKARTEHGILVLELPKLPEQQAPAVKEIPVE